MSYSGEPMSYERWLENLGVRSAPIHAEAYRQYLRRHGERTGANSTQRDKSTPKITPAGQEQT